MTPNLEACFKGGGRMTRSSDTDSQGERQEAEVRPMADTSRNPGVYGSDILERGTARLRVGETVEALGQICGVRVFVL